MERICAWCQQPMDKTDSADPAADEVSHGICPDCLAYMRTNQPGRSVREFLNTIKRPVLLVDETGIVRMANETAMETLQKPEEMVDNHPGGDVMECAYSRLPGGCGNTEHCKACTIRRTVMETHADGMVHGRITALQQIMTPDGIREMRFIITTEKKGNYVLLRIDEMGVAAAESA